MGTELYVYDGLQKPSEDQDAHLPMSESPESQMNLVTGN